MKTYSIEKEKNICSRCGDSSDQLIHHSEGQFWCSSCEELYDEFIISLEQKKIDDEDHLASMCY